MIMYLYFLLIASLSVSAQQIANVTTGIPVATQSLEPPVETNGFNDKDMNTPQHQESWLKQNNRFVFIIIVGIVVLALLTWYIVRSIRGMRRRLASENQGHMMMMQETVDTNGFHKMPDYPSQHVAQQKQMYEHRY